MKTIRSFKLLRFGVPVLLVLAAIGTEIPLHAVSGEKGFMLLYPAVFAGALIGGLCPGLLATLLATAGMWFVLLPGNLIHLAVFGLMGLLFSIFSEHLRRLNEQEKQVEERLKLALQAARMGSWDWDLENDQVWRSEGHDQLFGISFAGSMKLGAFMDFVHPDDRERVRGAVRESLHGKDDYEVEYRVIWPNGSEHWILTQGKVFRDANGEPKRLTGCSLDVTERRSAEDQRIRVLNTSRDILQREKELRERFVATLSHDLRNPLAAAKTAAQVMVRRSATPRDPLLFRILGSIERADRMVQDFLDANLIRAGQKLPIHVENCDLCEVLREVIEDLCLVHGKRFLLECPDRIEGFWCRQGLRRVIENLANNAVKYGKAKAFVVIALRHVDGKVLVSVRNEGNGLSADEQRTMFDAFQRTRSAEESGQKGWGLGLTLVRGIVDAHGGSVRVQSAPGEGATFTIELPVDSRQSESERLFSY